MENKQEIERLKGEVEHLRWRDNQREVEIERLKTFHTAQGPRDIDAIEGDLNGYRATIKRLELMTESYKAMLLKCVEQLEQNWCTDDYAKIYPDSLLVQNRKVVEEAHLILETK